MKRPTSRYILPTLSL